jgi:PAS domain S-box-containing protein
MNLATSAPVADAEDEIATLIETLLATERRLEELTGGEVDTVAGRDGRTFLLRRAQEELRHSEAAKQAGILNELRVLFDLMPAMIWFKDTKNNILRINKHAADAVGKPVAEIEGKPSVEIYPQEAAKYYTDDLEVIQSGEPKLEIVETVRDQQGQGIWVQTDKVPYFDKDGKVIGIVVVAQDTTERMRVETSLMETSALLEALLANTTDHIYFKDLQSRFVRFSRNMLEHFNLTSPDELKGRIDFDFFTDEHARPAFEAEQEIIRTGQPILDLEEKVTHNDGRVEWVLTSKMPWRDQVGKVIGTMGISRNITERKRTAVLLAESGRRLALAKESAHIGIWEWDVESNKLIWDAQMYLLYGIPEQMFSGAYESWQMGLHPDDRTRIEAQIFAAVDDVNGFHAEFRVVWPGGEVRHIEAHAAVSRTKDGNSPRMIGVNWDITERKHSEAAVHRLAAIVESSADAIISKTLDGIITSWNPAAEKMFGYPAAEIIGQPLLLLLPPERAQEEAEILAGFVRGEMVRHFETVRLRKGGQRFDVAVTISPLKDAVGQIVGASKIVRDITELKKLEHQFRQTQKMESFGQLAGGVAHDFNNILAVIQMQAELFKDDARLTPEQLDCAGEIVVATQRAAALTRQLLLFSRKEVLQLRDLDLNQSINGMTSMLRRILGEDIQVQFKFSLQTLGIHADAGMMDQVLMNLAVNARDAMPKGGQLVIETTAVTIDKVTSAHSTQARPGAFVCLSVGDNGSGIAPENLARIFEPFFTTKEVGKGTGLGLATVFGIVQQHKGWVTVDSVVGAGTTFRIYLPRLAKISSAPQNSEQPKLNTLPGGNETILLVEDDDFLRPSICNALSRLGYRVISVSNGIKALEIWQERHDEIQLVLTDLVMPGGMTGKNLVERLLEQNPKLKFISASGYSPDNIGANFALKDGVNFLIKPFQADKLAKIIRDRLDGKSAVTATP